MAGIESRLLTFRGWVLLCRGLIWLMAICFLIIETLGVFQFKQDTQVAVFALLFVLANFQLRVARSYKSNDQELPFLKAKLASLQMFLASIFAVSDAALDLVIETLLKGKINSVNLFTGALFVIGWFINLAMILLAIISFDRFMRLLSSDMSQLSHDIDQGISQESFPRGMNQLSLDMSQVISQQPPP